LQGRLLEEPEEDSTPEDCPLEDNPDGPLEEPLELLKGPLLLCGPELSEEELDPEEPRPLLLCRPELPEEDSGPEDCPLEDGSTGPLDEPAELLDGPLLLAGPELSDDEPDPEELSEPLEDIPDGPLDKPPELLDGPLLPEGSPGQSQQPAL
jgi:hypothetical protein